LINGYMGKIFWVDLTHNEIREEFPAESLYRNYIGGFGLGAKLIFDRQKKGVEALGPDNTLGFLTGTFSGTQALGASRYVVAGKSPLTGTWGDANSGGYFGPALKFAGCDAVFFTGIAARPVYLLINSGKAEIRDAGELWGKDCYETEDSLKAQCGADTEIACIGPAGEKVALLACVINNRGRAAGRSGLGAVMGAKKLKAIAVRGKLPVPLFDQNAVAALRKTLIPQLGGPIGGMRAQGSSGTFDGAITSGDAPVKNWTGVTARDFPQYEKINGNVLVQKETKKFACYRCVVACGAHLQAGTGEYQYEAGVHKPEYETMGMFGSSCLNDNVESIIKVTDICNRYGVDTIGAGAAMAFTIECFENGILTRQDTDGLEMTWGNHRSIVAMTEKLVKREGFGAIIADGTQKAAERIGKGAEAFAINIQGQDYPAHDPRRDYTWKIAYIMDPTPGRHTRAPNLVPPGVPQPEFDPNSFKGRAEAHKIGIEYNHVAESAGCCQFVMGTWPHANVLPDFLNAITGWNLSMDELLRTGERITNIRQAFNLREGINQFQYKGADRMIGKPSLTGGPFNGQVIDEGSIARELCAALDWDPRTAVPSKKKLIELGMEDIAQVLQKEGILKP
jgi:aldehyde:ferredoxin oxidoreductase